MRFTRTIPLVAGVLLAWACSNDSAGTGLKPGEGRMLVKLKDAPFPVDSAKSVDVFVVRVEGKTESTTEAEAAGAVDQASAHSDGWVTVAEPNAKLDLLTLVGANVATLGQAAVAAGTYQSLRFILDLSQSSVTLKNDVVLSATSSPSILFPSAGETGIKIQLDHPIAIVEGATTTVLVDFDVGESFVLRGNTILQNGLLFRPVIHATVQGN